MNNPNPYQMPPPPYFMHPRPNYPYFQPPQSPIFYYAHYPQYSPNMSFYRYPFAFQQNNNLQMAYRRPIKSAQSDAIIVIEDEHNLATASHNLVAGSQKSLAEIKETPNRKLLATNSQISTGVRSEENNNIKGRALETGMSVPPIKSVPLAEPKETQKKKQSRTLSLTNDEYQYLEKKVCEKCRRVESDDKLLLCDYCDDAYHSYCLGEVLVDLPDEHEIWGCPLCRAELEQIEKKEAQEREAEIEKMRGSNNCMVLLDQHFKNYWMKNSMLRMGQIPPEFQDMSKFQMQINTEVCVSCQSGFSQDKPESCFICKTKFHHKCLNPRNEKNAIICYICEQRIKSP